MIGRFRRQRAQQQGFDVRQPQPVIDPMAIEPELSGVQSRILEVSHNRVMLGAGLFAVAFVVITIRLAMVTLLPDAQDVAVARKPGVPAVADRAADAYRRPLATPSRVADNLYWIGRYLERITQLVRGYRHGLAGSLTHQNWRSD